MLPLGTASGSAALEPASADLEPASGQLWIPWYSLVVGTDRVPSVEGRSRARFVVVLVVVVVVVVVVVCVCQWTTVNALR